MPDDTLLAVAKAVRDRLKTDSDLDDIAAHIHAEDGDLANKVNASILKSSLLIVCLLYTSPSPRD